MKRTLSFCAAGLWPLLTLLLLSFGTFYSAVAKTNLVVERDITIDSDLGGLKAPRWSGDTLVTVSGNRTAAPAILRFDADGRRQTPLLFSIPGAEIIDIRSLSVGKNGLLAVGGAAFDSSGRGSGFIGSVPAGSIQTTVTRTAPFEPYRVVAADDGSIWAEGLELIDGSEHRPGIDLSHGVLRQYNAAGRELRALLPRSSIAEPFDLMFGVMAAGPDRIGWVTGPAYGPGSRCYEISSDGKVSTYPQLPVQSGERVTGLALTGDGRAWITITGMDSKGWRLYSVSPSARLLDNSTSA